MHPPKRLEDATSRLSELRKLVEEEKIPLSADIRRLEREAQEKRTEVDRLNRIRDNRDANLIQLKEEVKTGNAEIESIRRILADYTRSWAETMPPAERINLKDMHEEFANSSNGNRKEEIQSLLNTTKLSAKFIEKQAGGMKFSGNAIVPPEGTREEGLFWSIGPVLYFAGEQGSSGLVEKHSSSSSLTGGEFTQGIMFSDQPARIIPTSEKTSQLILRTLNGDDKSKGSLPLDPTLSKASVLEVGEPTIIEELEKGGIWIYPILFSPFFPL